MPSIDLSDETFRRLFAHAESFDDTPEQVIRRVLDQVEPHPSRGSRKRAGTRQAAPGTLLPEREYWAPILSILAEAGGDLPATEVIDILGEELADRLLPADMKRLPTGETRWKNRARFARLRMKEQGLLGSPQRGVWSITDEGRQFLANRRQSANEDDR